MAMQTLAVRMRRLSRRTPRSAPVLFGQLLQEGVPGRGERMSVTATPFGARSSCCKKACRAVADTLSLACPTCRDGGKGWTSETGLQL